MKKVLLSLGLLIVATAAFAGGENYNNNMSIEYIRTMSRNASTDADAVHYNPAGTAKLKDGIHLYLSSQTIIQTQQVSDSTETTFLPAWFTGDKSNEEYQGDVMAPAFPNFYAVYKTGDLGIMAGFEILSGGGGGTFSDGLPMLYKMAYGNYAASVGGLIGAGFSPELIVSGDFEASAFGLTPILGASYAINDMISVSLAGKYIVHMQSAKGTMTTTLVTPGGPPGSNGTVNTSFDWTEDAQGWGVIGGVNVAPIEGLNIGLRYEYYSEMTAKIKNAKEATTDPTATTQFAQMYPDDTEVKKQVPMVVALGVSYDVTKELAVSVSGTTWLHSMTDWGKDADDASTPFGLGIDAGLGIEYAITKEFTASLGYLYAKTGKTDKLNSEMSFGLRIYWSFIHNVL